MSVAELHNILIERGLPNMLQRTPPQAKARIVCASASAIFAAACLLCIQSASLLAANALDPVASYSCLDAVPEAFRTPSQRVIDFSVDSSGVTCLVHCGCTALSSILVRFDHAGRPAGNLVVPMRGVQDFSIGPAGRIAILAQDADSDRRPLTKVSMHSGLGDAGSIVSQQGIISPLAVADAAFAVDYQTKTLRRLASGAQQNPTSPMAIPLAVEFPPLYRLAYAGSGRIAILELAHHRLHLVNTKTGQVDLRYLSDAKISAAYDRIPADKRWVNRPVPAASARSTALWGMTAAPDGRVFVGLTGFRIADGAPFLQFGEDGTSVRTLTCRLPEAKPQGSGKRDFVVPYDLAFWNGALYLLVTNGGVVKYTLP